MTANTPQRPKAVPSVGYQRRLDSSDRARRPRVVRVSRMLGFRQLVRYPSRPRCFDFFIEFKFEGALKSNENLLGHGKNPLLVFQTKHIGAFLTAMATRAARRLGLPLTSASWSEVADRVDALLSGLDSEVCPTIAPRTLRLRRRC